MNYDEPALDILKYQFPPPNGLLIKNAPYSGGIKNQRIHVMWQVDIPSSVALVIRSLKICWYLVESAVRSDAAKFQALVANTKIRLYPDIAASDLAGDLVTNANLPFLTVLYPVTVAKPAYGDNAFYQEPAAWEGPLVVGGPRKIVVALNAVAVTMAAGAAMGEVAASLFAWTMPDPEGVWKEAHKI